MPQICKVCIHPSRELIDAELSRDWERSLRAIGAEYGLSKDAIFRHSQRHLLQETEDEARQVDEIAEHEKGPEALQMAEVVEKKKEPDTPQSPALWTPEQWADFRRQMADLAERIRQKLNAGT